MEKVHTNNTTSTPCSTCGAPMVYHPELNALVCSYCNDIRKISDAQTLLVELDYLSHLENNQKNIKTTQKSIQCNNCKAVTQLEEHLKTWNCDYCGSPLTEEQIHEDRSIKPSYILPFKLNKTNVSSILKDWVSSLWFAPDNLKKAALSPDQIKGVYIPFWTFDSQTHTQYTGERGEAYYVTVGSDNNRRTERRIKWYSARGEMSHFYDDILVSGNTTLKREILHEIQPGWDPKAVVEINNDYLEGFITEKYQLDLRESFQEAKKIIEGYEYQAIKRDIGGDTQKVYEHITEHHNVTFKHILLPIYISSFLYQNKVYTYYINGVTGHISGERPYSTTKIIFAVLAVAVLLALLFIFKQ